MKVTIDFPGEPDRAVVPLPYTVENAAGVLFLVVSYRDGKLAMQYNVRRDAIKNSDNAVSAVKLEELMKNLEALAKRAADEFNRINGITL